MIRAFLILVIRDSAQSLVRKNFDTPVQSVEGEDISIVPNLNVIEPVEGVFSRSVTVEGGPDNKVISKFNGPVIFNNKVSTNLLRVLKQIVSLFKVMQQFQESIQLVLQLHLLQKSWRCCI